MPLKRAFVVHGSGGWDEPTPLGDFLLLDVQDGAVRESRRGPADYGMRSCAESELMGGEAPYNAAALRRVLRGAEHGGHRDALVLGAALALEVTGRAPDALSAATLAAAAIDGGAAADLLLRLEAFSSEAV
jgi:anthranilate phosphoribosyltransferase